MSTRDRRDLPERLRDIASTLERHGWLRDKGERPVYWVEKAADEITHLERERDGLRSLVTEAIEQAARWDGNAEKDWVARARFVLRSFENAK